MKLHIKYMVSIRCKMTVKAELEKLGIQYGAIDLGEVDIQDDITKEQIDQLRIALETSGLELMDDKKAILIQKIKNEVVEMIHYADELPKLKNSEYLSKRLKYSYAYLANVFSESTGITLEHFIILHKIEKVKELLLYDELNLTEIAFKVGYSSSAHLSNQFKRVTGLTPSYYKKLKNKRLSPLEKLGMI